MKKSVLKLVSLTLILGLGVSLTGCKGQAENPNTITIGVSPEPHRAIVEEAVKPELEKEGYEVKIVEFTDYILPNKALAEGELDANYFQHVPYLESTVEESGYNLTYTAKVHIEPMGVYSKQYDDFSEIKDGAEIAVPNDPSNEARALKILADNGLIKVAEGDLITANDIIENPKNIKIMEVDAEQLPRILEEVDAAVINTNYALESNLNPLEDAIILESTDSPYSNIIAIRSEDADNKKIEALSKAATSEAVKKFIVEKYNGAIIPAF